MKQTLVESFNNIPNLNLDKIVVLFHRALGRPLLLGQIADGIGWSLERTEMMINSLIEKGVVRRANSEEIKVLDCSATANAFCLVGVASLSLAAL